MADVDTKRPYEEDVEAGIEFFDTNYPGWRGRVNIDTVNMRLSHMCMLAQASGKSYYAASWDHHMSFEGRVARGFTVSNPNLKDEFDVLKAEWRRQCFS